MDKDQKTVFLVCPCYPYEGSWPGSQEARVFASKEAADKYAATDYDLTVDEVEWCDS